MDSVAWSDFQSTLGDVAQSQRDALAGRIGHEEAIQNLLMGTASIAASAGALSEALNTNNLGTMVNKLAAGLLEKNADRLNFGGVNFGDTAKNMLAGESDAGDIKMPSLDDALNFASSKLLDSSNLGVGGRASGLINSARTMASDSTDAAEAYNPWAAASAAAQRAGLDRFENYKVPDFPDFPNVLDPSKLNLSDMSNPLNSLTSQIPDITDISNSVSTKLKGLVPESEIFAKPAEATDEFTDGYGLVDQLGAALASKGHMDFIKKTINDKPEDSLDNSARLSRTAATPKDPLQFSELPPGSNLGETSFGASPATQIAADDPLRIGEMAAGSNMAETSFGPTVVSSQASAPITTRALLSKTETDGPANETIKTGEDVAEDVGEDIGEDVAEDSALGVLGPVGAVIGLGVDMWQLVSGIAHDFEHHTQPIQMMSSYSPDAVAL